MKNILLTVFAFLSGKHHGNWHVISDSNASFVGARVTILPTSVYVCKDYEAIVPVRSVTLLKPLDSLVISNSKMVVSLGVREKQVIADLAGSSVKLSSKQSREDMVAHLDFENDTTVQATFNSSSLLCNRKLVMTKKSHDDTDFPDNHVTPFQLILSLVAVHTVDSTVDNASNFAISFFRDLWKHILSYHHW